MSQRKRVDLRAEARYILDQADRAQTALDEAGWDHPLDSAMLAQDKVDDVYRLGFATAQRVSAEFFEEMASQHGFTTPTARAAWGLEREQGKDIEDLYPRSPLEQQPLDIPDTAEGWSF